MRTILSLTLLAALPLLGCAPEQQAEVSTPRAATGPQNIPPLEPTNIVSIAMKSKDHTTLVKAIQAADYVTSVAASGPFTVFAPTDAAFAKLPAGTLDTLLKPENVGQLRDILQYHVTTTAYETSWWKDGQKLAMANGAKATIGVTDGKVTIDGANVVASVKGSNGIVHVIDAVLVPSKP